MEIEYSDIKRPKTWKGLCLEHWNYKKNGNLLFLTYLSDDHCWSCGKKLDFKESHHHETTDTCGNP